MKITVLVRLSYRNTQKLVSAFRHSGFRGFFEEISNQSLIWDLPKKKNSLADHETSSISDKDGYREICELAAKNEDVRGRFKRNREYRLILEHVTAEQGKSYLSLISHNQEIMKNLTEISSREEGGPLTYTFGGLGKISPTQIRYAKVLNDLNILFGDLSQMKIAEIGIGNGGQAIHLLNYYKEISYFGYDLGPILELSSILIKGFNPDFTITMFDGANPNPQNVDLIISNYAFSELNLKTQEMYLEKLISNSKKGYMVYNHIHPVGSSSISAVDFAKRIPGAEIFQEIPLTFKGNVLVAWGHQKNLPNRYFKKISN